MVTIGIDPHKSSHTAVALDETGAMLGELRVLADNATLSRLGAWAAGWPQRVWAIEGATGLGRLLAQQLVAAGESVSTSRPRWPRALACWHAVMAARPTASTRAASLWLPSSTATYSRSPPMTTAACFRCSQI